MDSISKKRFLNNLVAHCQRRKNSQDLKTISETRIFDRVYEVDLSKCSSLNFDALIDLLSLSLPSLLVLNLSYCSRFKTEDLFSLLWKCSSLTNVVLTVDISPIIPTPASLTSESYEQYPTASGVQYASVWHLPVVSKLVNLTLEGRTDLKGKMQSETHQHVEYFLRSHLISA